MNLAEKIYHQASKFPPDLAREVLDFIEYIEKKHNICEEGIENLKEAQLTAMSHVWDNQADEVWDENPSI